MEQFPLPLRPPAHAARWFAVTAFLGMAAAFASAQTVKERLDITRESIENQRRVLVSGAVPMTEAEAKAFWPVYDDYEKKRRALDERATRLVADFVANAATFSDAQAKSMLAQALEVDEGRLKMRREVLDRLQGVIPARTLVRYYQIENKLDSVVRADLSRQIPLVP